MRFFDEKFREHKANFILQSLLAGCAIAFALSYIDIVNKPAIVASFGASAFIAFTMPHRMYSRPRYLIGGYVIGVITGCILHFLTVIPCNSYAVLQACHVLAGGLAVALSMLAMTVFNVEHPPASGIALGFVVHDWTWMTVVHVMMGICIIALVQKLLSPMMKDLLGE